MATCLKTIVKIVLAILPIICAILLTISIMFLVIANNQAVKWSEYDIPKWGMRLHYYATIWKSIDFSQIENRTNGGTYLQVLNRHAEDFKVPVRDAMMKSIGLASGAAFFLTVSLAVHAVTKQKLFVLICNVISLGGCGAAAFFTVQSTRLYKNQMKEAIVATILPQYTISDEQFLLGYSVTSYSGIINMVGAALLAINIGLYVPFGDGKWIWRTESEVAPVNDEEKLFQKNNMTRNAIAEATKNSMSTGSSMKIKDIK